MKRLIFIVIGLWQFLILSVSQIVEISGIPNNYLQVDMVLADRVQVTETIAGELSQFVPGDIVLLIQMTGVSLKSDGDFLTDNVRTIKDPRNAGRFEIFQIDDVVNISGIDYVIFTDNVSNTYDPGEKIQLVKFTAGETVSTTAQVTAHPWDGAVGGIVAIIGTDSVRLKHNIDVSGIGFRGGSVPDETYTGGCRYKPALGELDTLYFFPYEINRSGNKGEGVITSTWPYSKGTGFNVSGGGGGNGLFSGGGGGSNYEAGGDGGKQASECNLANPAMGGWGGYGCKDLYNNLVNDKPRIFMGGGGGSGTKRNLSVASPGGDGGGIVIIITGTLTSEGGSILANGETPVQTNGTGGGGGAGGAVLVDATSVPMALNISIKGGNGGSTTDLAYCTGSGGGGGGGVFWHSGSTVNASANVDAGEGGTAMCIPQRGSPGGEGAVKSDLISPLTGFLFNTIRGIDTVCVGIAPKMLTASQPKGGDGSYLHFWEHSTDNMNWTTATGTELRNFQPSVLTQTTLFRRVVTSDNIKDTSRVIKVFVYPAIGSNSITGIDTICYNDSAKPILGTVATGGNSTTYTYQWLASSDQINWSENGTELTANDPLDPGKLTSTMYFSRLVKSTVYCNDTSSSVKVTVLPLLTSFGFATPDTVICMNQSPGQLNALTPSGGDGTYSYSWQLKPSSGNWTQIGSSNVLRYMSGVLAETTLFRRIVYSGNDNACVDTSESKTVTIKPLVTNNRILGDPVKYTCNNTPIILSGTLPQNGFDTYAYQWEHSDDNLDWQPAEGTRQHFETSNLTNTKYFRRTVFSSPANHECSDTSEVVEVRINPLPTGDILDIPDTVCAGETLYVKFTAAGNGPFNITVQGESNQSKSGVYASPDSIPFVPEATFDYKMVTVQDDSGCFADATGFINVSKGVVYEVPEAFGGEDADVCGDTYTLNAVKSVIGSSGMWTAAGAIFGIAENENSSVTVDNYGTNVLTWTETNWHCMDEDEVEITFFEQPQMPDAGPDQVLDFNYTTQLHAVPLSVGRGQWTIESGSGEFSNDTIPDAFISELNEVATLKWTVTNGNCPAVSDIMELLITPLVIKKGFTPNGDGKNDFFDLGAGNAERIRLKVFNSAGVLVFESEDYAEGELWEGYNMNGLELSEGTYFYIATIKVAGKREEVQFRSFVEILR